MKKLFTLVVLMCLLGGNRAWAADYITFKNYYQLANGTTTFNYLSAPLYLSDNSTISETDKKNNFIWTVQGYEGITDLSKNESTGELSFSGTGVIVVTAEDNYGYITKNLSAANNTSLPCDFNEWSGNVQFASSDFTNAEEGDIIRGYVSNASSYEVALKNGPGVGDWYGNFGGASDNIYPNTKNSSYFDYVITSSMLRVLQSSGCGFQGTGGFKLNSVALVKKGKASYKIRVLTPEQKYVWDFNKLPPSIAPTSGNWRQYLDSQWTRQSYSSDAEIVYEYNNTVSGNNADLIADTHGLTITTTGNKTFGVSSDRDFAEGYKAVGTQYRYIELKQGAKIVIPGLSANDRVRMFIDRYGNNITLNFNNKVQDAVGTNITSDYKIGGTSWFTDKNGKSSLQGYYNFIMNSDGDFEMTLKESSGFMKIYYIEVYTGDFKMTNEIHSDAQEYTLVTKSGEQMDHNPQYYLHYRGKGEPYAQILRLVCTGTLQLQASDFTTTFSGHDYFNLDASKIVDKFGAFKLGLGVKEANGSYITDYAERIMSVGYYEEVGHPYTWDFTDILPYSSSLIQNDYSNYHNNNVFAATGSSVKSVEDMNCWAEDGQTFTFTRSNPSGAPFAWGSQLYAYNEMIPEVRGIAFTPVHMTDGTIALTNEGLKIESPWDDPYAPSALEGDDVQGMALFSDGYKNDSDEKMRIWETPWTNFKDDSRYPKPLYYDQAVADKASYATNDPRFGWKLTVYDVPNQTAIYIRVKTIAGKKPKLRFDFIRTGNVEVDGEMVPRPDPAVGWNFFKKKINNGDGTFDIIVGMSPTQSASQQPIHFILNNVIVERIATSKDIKYIGQTGHATESRFRTIDHRLNEFFSNEPIKAYQGKFSSDYSQLILKEVEIMEKATADNQLKYGTVLIHSDGTPAEGGFTNKSVNVIDGGFHMFVPDMHDYPLSDNVASGGSIIDERGSYTYDGQGADDISENVLISKAYDMNVVDYIFNVKESLAPFGDAEKNITNLILSAKKYTFGGNGTDKGNGYDVFFIRVDPSKTATVPGYSAYIQIPTEKMKELTSGSTNGAKMSIVFEDEWFGEINNGIATGIDQVTSNKSQVTNAEWYNLNGQKLNGMPTEKGLYIVNGRKVLVK